MKFEHQEVIEFQSFFSERDNNVLLEKLFERKALWELRKDRVPPYKNADWYTLGASSYLDLKSKSDWDFFCDKIKYFNSVLSEELDTLWKVLLVNLKDATGENFEYAEVVYPHMALPGFHIFPPHHAATEFFGNPHQDLQWKPFTQFPGLETLAMTFEDHFSGTYCLSLPKQGPHFLFGDDLENGLTYRERAMYLHSGQFLHAIAPLQRPITMLDWRITLQFHGFKHNDVNWIYW